MAIQASTIRPGMLVVLKSSVSGNVSHKKEVIEAEKTAEDGSQKSRWETERVVANPDEFTEATKLRNKARGKIADMCIQTAFGLLCPDEKVELLETKVAEPEAICAEFNGRSTCTTIGIYIVAGRVAADDAKAIRAINSEVRDLMDTMETGLRELDIKKVRRAAEDAKKLGSMLSPAAAERVKEAIDIVRKAATDMKKAAEQGAAEIDLLAIQKLTASRTAFLDIDAAPAEVETPTHEARMIDLAPAEIEHVATEAPAIDLAPVEEETVAPAPIAAPVPQFEMGE